MLSLPFIFTTGGLGKRNPPRLAFLKVSLYRRRRSAKLSRLRPLIRPREIPIRGHRLRFKRRLFLQRRWRLPRPLQLTHRCCLRLSLPGIFNEANQASSACVPYPVQTSRDRSPPTKCFYFGFRRLCEAQHNMYWAKQSRDRSPPYLVISGQW